MLKNIKIKWKLFGFFLVFISILLIVLWLLQTVFLGNIYKTIKTNHICSIADKIEEHIDQNNLRELIEKETNNNNYFILLFTQDGTLIQPENSETSDFKLPPKDIQYLIENNEKNPEKSSFLDLPQTEFIKQTEKKENFHLQPEKFSRGFHSFMNDTLIYSRNIQSQDGENYLLLIAAMIAPVDTTVKTLRIELIYITIIMLVLALIFAMLFSKKISKPIEEINTSAKILAEGNYDIHFSGDGYREISELAETLNHTAKELSKVESLRRELIANVSHDLRTPLTMITGYSEVMRDIPGENTPENIQIIIDEANRLTNLVNDMLDLSKLQEGEPVLHMKSFHFTESIRAIIQRYEKMHDMQGYHFNLEAAEDVMIQADENKIHQVIYNLINNAITYCGKDQTITIRQIVKDQHLRLEVCDTGEGIAPEDIPYIWDRYYKVNKSHKRAHIGTGLGLSIVKKIITLHHGLCGVESQLGQGSIFWFELPLG